MPDIELRQKKQRCIQHKEFAEESYDQTTLQDIAYIYELECSVVPVKLRARMSAAPQAASPY
ncbi:MAG: hypothetical protein GX141_12370 [Armatimonadetes bacterium]|nr:hypothetical protein [Armatimonadota bacterium]